MDNKKYKGQIKVSSEKQFVYQDSFNRGHIQLPRMIINCLNLSSTAKIAYGVISGHVYEHGKSAFPSVSRIAMACNCTKKTAIKYINELIKKGFIVKERKGNGRTNDYFLVDVDMVTHLHVSEMFWRAFNAAYKELGAGYEELFDVMTNMLDDLQKKGVEFKDIPVNAETEEKIKQSLLQAVKKRSDNDMFKPPNLAKERPEAAVPTETQKESRKLNKQLSGVSRFSLPDDVDKWKNDHFVQYFYEKYIDATGKTHEAARSKHRGIMGRIIRNLGNDKMKVKRYIDAFFEIGYESPTLEWFGTSGRLTELDMYIEEGKKPFYLTSRKKKEQIKNAEQQNKGLSAESFLKRIKQFD